MYSNRDVVFVVQRQVPAAPDHLDPYADYPHVPARIYCNSLSPKQEIVHPDWVLSHYARWAMDKEFAAVLILSRVCLFMTFHVISSRTGLVSGLKIKLVIRSEGPDLWAAISR